MTKSQQEYIIQCQISEYCFYKNIACFGIPMGEARASYKNGVYDKIQAQKIGRRIKQMGGKRGIADMLLICNNKTIYVEVKSEKGIQTKEQKEFEKICKNNKQEYHIVKSLDEFIKIIS
jgi:predicted AAA+ superfamily ATPase